MNLCDLGSIKERENAFLNLSLILLRMRGLLSYLVKTSKVGST